MCMGQRLVAVIGHLLCAPLCQFQMGNLFGSDCVRALLGHEYLIRMPSNQCMAFSTTV